VLSQLERLARLEGQVRPDGEGQGGDYGEEMESEEEIEVGITETPWSGQAGLDVVEVRTLRMRRRMMMMVMMVMVMMVMMTPHNPSPPTQVYPDGRACAFVPPFLYPPTIS
jgi:hypothetical protein